MNGSSAFRPTLLAVDDEPEELVSLERELEKRMVPTTAQYVRTPQKLSLYRRVMKGTLEFFAIASPASRVRRDARDQPESGKT